ncbi:MAG: aminotransferase class IV [Cryomorphaceae bacterium]|nr:aminotransferase class IV [Cryomorphaceae bacterium]
MQTIFLNGEFFEKQQIEISTDDRGLNYGDGVFETIRFDRGQIHWPEDHYFRLMANMRIMRMHIPENLTPEYFSEVLTELVRSNHWEKGAVRLRFQAWRKAGGKYSPNTNEVNLLATAERLTHNTYTFEDGDFRIDIFKDYPKPKGLLSNVKSCNAQLYILASIFRMENQLDECLLINNDKNVVEAISSNIFMVQGKTIKTPPLSSGCIKGIMRKKISEKLAPYLGYEVVEEDFNPFALLKADEVFLTNSIRGIQPVTHYKKKVYEVAVSRRILEMVNAQFEP